MGTFRKGILGGFSGTVGTVVGGNWKGVDYMRSRPVTKKNAKTPAQDVQRLKFSMASKLLRSMKPLLAITFKEGNARMTGSNSALSYLLKNAIMGEYPDFQIDYRMLLVARGVLPGVVAPIASAAATPVVNFTWQSNEGIGIAAANDKAIVVAYHPPTNSTHYVIGKAFRNSGTATLDLPMLKGEEVETYIAFIDDSGKEVSPSQYTGKVKLA